MRFALSLMSALMLAAVSFAAAGDAQARARHAQALSGDYAVAESHFGNGSVTGAVRSTSLGPQVQLPGGHWEYCRRSCAETLRVQSIDFNQGDDIHLGKGTIGNECGIFGCLEVGVSHRRRGAY